MPTSPTPEIIAALLGLALSIALQLPGVADAWALLSSDYKRYVLLFVAIVIGAGSLIGSCAPDAQFTACVVSGWGGALSAAFVAAGSLQGAYTASEFLRGLFAKK